MEQKMLSEQLEGPGTEGKVWHQGGVIQVER